MNPIVITHHFEKIVIHQINIYNWSNVYVEIAFIENSAFKNN